MDDELSPQRVQATSKRTSAQTREPRWSSDTDPLRARVLFELTAIGFERRHHRRPSLSDLNHHFPASPAASRAWGTWNRLVKGKGLPRKLSSPQSYLMKKLASVDPYAAASLDWVLWPLASQNDLTLAEIHALMLELPDGVGHMLIRRMPTGHYYRAPTSSRSELKMFLREDNLGGFMGLVALLREAEVEQDVDAYVGFNDAMRLQFHLVRRALFESSVSEDLCSFLAERFAQMRYYFRGAYERHPRESQRSPPVQTILKGVDFEAARIQFETDWLYGAKDKPSV